MLKGKTFLLGAMAAPMTGLAVAVAFVLAVAPGVWAQQAAAQKPGNIMRVYFAKAKPGSEAEYEAGRKRHVEAHKQMGDTWTWVTFQVETGDRAGTYDTVTFEHHWKEFDEWEQKHGDADAADAAKNLAPHSVDGGNSFFMYLRDASMTPAGQEMAPPDPLIELIHFELKIGASQEFERAITRTTEAIRKTKWATNFHWYSLVNGGQSPHYVLALPKKSWAEMEPPAMPFPVMLEKGLGAAEAKTVLAAFDRTVARESSEMLRFRPDLSYVPEKK
ncbi:MAG: hypothetical protein ACRD5G_01850 [Candidatus Acidiferrales bacterium]